MRVRAILLVLSLSVTIGTVWYYTKRNSVLKQRYQECSEQLTISETNQALFEKIVLKFSTQLTVNAKEVVAKFGDLRSNTNELVLAGVLPKLVLRFKETTCDACYNKQLELLGRLSEEIKPGSIAVILSFSQERGVKVLAKTQSIKYPIYNIPKTNIGSWPCEQYTEPYYFLIEKDSSITTYFTPEKTIQTMTDAYFNYIKRKLK